MEGTWLNMTLKGQIDRPMLESFNAAFAQTKCKNVRLWIYSEGGVVADAFEMFDKLQRHPALVTIACVQADSAASLIFLGGRKRVIVEGSQMLIHQPRLLDGEISIPSDPVREHMIGLYVTRTGLAREQVVRLMENEAVLDAEQAVALGFAHSIGRFKAFPGSTAVPIPSRKVI